MIKSFRGLLADGAQERISLATIKGKVGYKIVKFQAMASDPSENIESVLKIYKSFQSAVDDTINFTDSDLLASLLITQSSSGHNYPEDQTVVFDLEVFNQDIYITLKGTDYTANVNYYFELEQFPLASDEATVATLKDIKLNA